MSKKTLSIPSFPGRRALWHFGTSILLLTLTVAQVSPVAEARIMKSQVCPGELYW